MPLTVSSPEGKKVHARSEPFTAGEHYSDLRVSITLFEGESSLYGDPQHIVGAETARLKPEEAEKLAAKLLHSAAFARHMEEDGPDPNAIGGGQRMNETLNARLREILPDEIVERAL